MRDGVDDGFGEPGHDGAKGGEASADDADADFDAAPDCRWCIDVCKGVSAGGGLNVEGRGRTYSLRLGLRGACGVRAKCLRRRHWMIVVRMGILME